MRSEGSKTITLVLGGARSGKSRYAQKLASAFQRVTFIATARASDSEMLRKIAEHRRQRPASWRTCEAPVNLEAAIRTEGGRADVLLIDCLTVFLANIMNAKKGGPAKALDRIQRVCDAIQSTKASVLVVSNEVGSGVVPPFRSGRIYRDLLGELNQRIAEIADRVVLMIAGVPVAIKDGAAL